MSPIPFPDAESARQYCIQAQQIELRLAREEAEGQGAPWKRISKGEEIGRIIADRHYTRQTPGARSWTRPGYNHVLYARFETGHALWCWWRPKWEDGRPGTERKDGLRVLECTMFRREGKTLRASNLVRAAVRALQTPSAAKDLHLSKAGPIRQLITGIDADKTGARRGNKNKPGHCYRMAGWYEIDKKTKRAGVWLGLDWENPCQPTPDSDGGENACGNRGNEGLVVDSSLPEARMERAVEDDDDAPHGG
jgi:hypothetical protein